MNFKMLGGGLLALEFQIFLNRHIYFNSLIPTGTIVIMSDRDSLMQGWL
jgi:hypothetical protein